MNILITLCGRGGSKGIPGKNIKALNGTPLLAYSIKHAKEFAIVHSNVDILLSTDNRAIKEVASSFGLETDYVRPDYLANDTIGKIDVLMDAIKFQENKNQKKYDILLDLDITSPLRTQKDLNEGYSKLLADDKAINLFSVSKPHKNPYFNVVEASDDGYCKLVCPSDTKSRQTAPQVFDMNASFYFYRRTFFENGCKSAITERSLYYVMDHICFDLDEPLDFDIMEYLLANDKLGMTL
ncbi:acylneuraminate cytidylyltransferase family protein [Arenibacter sp. BSSL-BM3]|uniref:Acylneuraminate cytidylyltransferase family protein n=1 Tax=Arenibacter arenosicollis TaxID=2762274 RepID=A0ABR7QIY3_9FLAO|nr:acylneuraminate cytidylyltransferase family protein [Arenibacter arenosicollis]MBC8766920.1 acylneuraminate cytidylyltransferase family protein [Arenibacter arenosicollis]